MQRSRRLMFVVVSGVMLVDCRSSPDGARGSDGDRDAPVATPDGDRDAPVATPDGDRDAPVAMPDGGWSVDADDLLAAGELVDGVVGGEDPHRYQLADIVPLGGSVFAIGYLDPDRQLKYAYWDDGGRRGSGAPAGDDARWVRADTSGPLERPDPDCAPDGVARFNTLAVEIGTDVRNVRLDVHTYCGGRTTVVSHPIAQGVRPSSVTTGSIPAGNAKTLVVYGRLDLLAGRFLHHAVGAGTAAVLGDEFPIAHFTLGGAFSTDVIYNQHSERFIVGFIQRGGFGCSVWNVVLGGDTFPPTVLAGPTAFGLCDGDKGGHHTAVAYNPLGDGSYAWWRQDMKLLKSVVIHDQFGQLTSIPGLVTADTQAFGNIWTVPVTAGPDAAVPYLAMFGQPDVHLFRLGDGWQWTDWLPRFGPAYQVALRALPASVVALVRIPDGNAAAPTATLRLLRVMLP